jgi:hypothetical protein
VGLKPRIDTDIEFQFMHDPHANNNYELVKAEQVEAKAILIPRIVGNGEATDFEDMMDEEYEFDILWDSKKQLWVTTLKNGSYLINAKIKGFKEINEYVEIGGEERDFKF